MHGSQHSASQQPYISLVKNTQVFQLHSGGQETALLKSKDTALHKKQLN